MCKLAWPGLPPALTNYLGDSAVREFRKTAGRLALMPWRFQGGQC